MSRIRDRFNMNHEADYLVEKHAEFVRMIDMALEDGGGSHGNTQ